LSVLLQRLAREARRQDGTVAGAQRLDGGGVRLVHGLADRALLVPGQRRHVDAGRERR
jgi:hypothetical protein